MRRSLLCPAPSQLPRPTWPISLDQAMPRAGRDTTIADTSLPMIRPRAARQQPRTANLLYVAALGLGLAAMPAPALSAADASRPGQAVPKLQATPTRSTSGATAGSATGRITGVPRAPSCKPALYEDFMDNRSWNGRRVSPQDCARARTSAPVFAWPQPPDRDASSRYRLQVRSAGTGQTVLDVETDAPRMATRALLPLGEYQWQVSYRSRRGIDVASQARRFTVEAQSQPVVFPSGADLATRVAAKARPRMLPEGASFRAIAEAASESPLHQVQLDSLIKMADRALTTALPDEPGGDSTMTARRKSADREQIFIEASTMAAALTGDRRYLAHAINRLVNLARWDPAGPTSDANQDQANRQIYIALAQGMDMLWGELTAAQRVNVASAFEARMADAMTRLRRLDANPYDSHVNSNTWTTVEALLLAAGNPLVPQATTWLTTAWEILQTTADAWGGDDGGFGNGVGYAWWSLIHRARTMAALRVVGGVDMGKHPGSIGFGDYLIAMTAPNGDHMGPFGDDSAYTRLYNGYAHIDFRLYATLTAQPRHLWYQHISQSSSRRYPGMWQLMLLGMGLTPSSGTAPEHDAWHFATAGVVAFHSDSSSAERSSLFFRSSEFGAYNHSHADQNAFTFMSRGRDLLISGGYYPSYMSPHHAAVNRATRYKNALTFDGGVGQAEDSITLLPRNSRDARGKLLNVARTADWAVATGDATLAYRRYDPATRTWSPLLTNAVRSVAYNATAGVAVIYDWATSHSARRWELNFNALTPVGASGRHASVANAAASACIDIHGPDGTFTTSTGFEVAPENGAPDQHQARFSTAGTSSELVAITVLREDCRAVSVDIKFDGTRATVALGGAQQLSFDGRSATVSAPN
jgi:hypothetical protein